MVSNNKKISLNKKLIISLTSVILIVVISIGISINYIIKNTFEEYISQNNKKEINNLVKSIRESYLNNKWKIDSISEVGNNAIINGRFIDVYDENNKIVWSARKSNGSLCHQMMGSIKDNMKSSSLNWDGEYREEIFYVFNNKGDKSGYIKVGTYGSFYYLDDELKFLEELNFIILTIGTLTVAVTIIIAIIIANNISKPIKVVSEKAKIIGKSGDTKRLSCLSNIIEIDDLINSINELSLKLQEQELLRKRLTTDISHELRNPLTSIQTHIEALIDGIWEPTNDRLSSINEEIIRLNNLVEELKKLAKFDNEKSDLDLSLVNIKSIIENIVRNNQIKAMKKKINIKMYLQDTSLYLDKGKISQLILNLLSNAIKYTEEGGNIAITSLIENDILKIAVKDDGIGIPRESLDYIFERFYRVDKSRNKYTGGIGVGLTICKAIVEIHNGDIIVKSEEKNGTEFVVSLPIIID